MSIEAEKETPALGRAGVSLVVFGFSCGETPAGGSQRALERRGRLEANGLGRRDRHGFAGLRVAAGAGGALLDLERTKTDDLDFLVLLHPFGDRGEHGVEGFFGETLGGVFPEGGLNGINEFSFVHGNASL